MPIGRIKFFDDTRGYGFIAHNDGTPDVFLHISDIEAAGLDTPHTGDVLEYELGVNSRNQRPKAVKLRLIEG